MKDNKRRIGGNYPYGGKVEAKVDKELLDLIKKEYNSKTNIEIGDCVYMDNGWSL